MPSAIERVSDDDIAAPIVKERPISKRMQQVLTNLATKGLSQREAAKLAGMSEYHLSRELKKPQIQVFIARTARQNIQIGVLRASKRVLELIDADSEHVSLDASKHVLAIEGIKPSADTQVSVNIDIKAGYVIDLTRKRDPVIDVTPRAGIRDEL
jgi:PAB1-binding protein PBP1